MSGYSLKPGDAGYYTPDEKFSTSTPIDELIRGGYMLSDDQVSKLSPEQKAQYASAFFNIALEKQQAATGWGKPTGNNASLWSKPTGNNASFKTPQELMGQILELQGPQSTGLPVDIRGLVSGIGQQIVMAPLQKQRYDPRFPGKEVTTGKDPIYIHNMGWMGNCIA